MGTSNKNQSISMSFCPETKRVFSVRGGSPEEYLDNLSVTSMGLQVHALEMIPWPLHKKAGKGSSVISTPGVRKEFAERKRLWETTSLLMNYKKASYTGILFEESTGEPGKQAEQIVVLDFECSGLMDEFFQKLENSPELLSAVKSSYIEKTMSGGNHLFLKVPAETIKGRTELAKDEFGQLLIEILGGSGYVVTAPSPGYEIVSGNICRVINLNEQDTQTVLDVCRSFNKAPEGKLPSSMSPEVKTAPAPKPAEITSDSGFGSERDWKAARCNEIFWQYIDRFIEELGFKILSRNKNQFLCCHPFSTNWNEHNCVFGEHPEKPGAGHTFHAFSSFGNILGGKTYTPFNLAKELFGGSKKGSHEAINLAEKLQGGPLEPPVDENYKPFETDEKIAETDPDDQKKIANRRIEHQRRIALADDAALKSDCEGLLNLMSDSMANAGPRRPYQFVLNRVIALSFLGHVFADLIYWDKSRPVLHCICFANTTAGKGLGDDFAIEVLLELDEMENAWRKAIRETKKAAANQSVSIQDDEGKSELEKAVDDGRKYKKSKTTKKKRIPWIMKMGSAEGSWQGLEDELILSPHKLIVVDEAGDFFTSAEKEDHHFSETRKFFKKLYDCKPAYRARPLAGKPGKVIHALRPSILGYTQPGTIRFSREEMLRGGSNRWLMLPCGPRYHRDLNGKVVFTQPTGKDSAREIAKEIFKVLGWFREKIEAGETVTASPEFERLLNEEIDKRVEAGATSEEEGEEPDEIRGREIQNAIRIALIHMAQRRSMVLEPIDLKYGFRVLAISTRTMAEIIYANEKELQEASRLDYKNEAILKRAQNAIQRLCKDGRKLTASNIANSTFSAREKQFRKAEYFLSRLETEALAREWLTKDSKGNYEAGKGLYK